MTFYSHHEVEPHAAIARLPPELLSYIFTLRVQGEIAHQEENIATGRPFQTRRSQDIAVNLGLVCKHWRVIALSTSDIWTCISVPSYRFLPYRLERMVQRAQSRPIRLTVVDAVNRWSFIRILQMTADQVQTLHLYPASGTGQDTRAKPWWADYPLGAKEDKLPEMPNLTTLVLHDIPRLAPTIRWFNGDRVARADDEIVRHASHSLKNLVLRDCWFQSVPQLPNFPLLTSLRIAITNTQLLNDPNPLQVLACTPELQDFYLNAPGYMGPDHERADWAFPEDEEVILDKLKTIQIRSLGVKECAELLFPLQFAQIVAERYVLDFMNSPEERSSALGENMVCQDLEDFLLPMGLGIYNGEMPESTFRNVLWVMEEFSSRLFFWDDGTAMLPPPDYRRFATNCSSDIPSTIPLDIHLRDPYAIKSLCTQHTLTTALLSSLRVHGLQSLYLTQDEQDEITGIPQEHLSPHLFRFAQRHCEIKHLQVDHLTFAKILPLLCDTRQWGGTDSEQPGDHPLMRLESLTLYRVTIATSPTTTTRLTSCADSASRSTLNLGFTKQELVRMLRFRCEIGLPVGRLTFRKCRGVSGEILDELEREVPGKLVVVVEEGWTSTVEWFRSDS